MYEILSEEKSKKINSIFGVSIVEAMNFPFHWLKFLWSAKMMRCKTIQL